MFSGSSRKVLIDSNVLIAALRSPDGTSAAAFKVVVHRHTLVLSPQILAETDRNLKKLGLPPRLIRAFNRLLRDKATIVEPKSICRICRDPDDDAILAAAVESGADAIVTGDKDLLECRMDMKILTPRAFLDKFHD